jgi:hypothetical protein
MPNRLLKTNKRLVASGKRLFNTDAGTSCCCDSEFAYRFCECCDGEPCFWVADYVFGESRQPCDSIQLGVDSRTGKPVCFQRTGERRTLRELEQAGIQYIIQFGPDDGCNGASCREIRNGGPCRDCPDDCCIYGALPLCDRPNQFECVVLGSAYRLKYTYTVVAKQWGVADGAFFARIDPVTGEQCCFGDSQPLIREQRTQIQYEAFFNKCPFTFNGVRRFDSESKLYVNDGYRFNEGCPGSVEPINPRIVTTSDSNVDTNALPFSLGEYPSFGIPSCAGTETQTVRGCNGNPADPITAEIFRQWSGAYGRLSGSFNLVERRREFVGACGCATIAGDGERVFETVYSGQYNVDILNTTGCERLECPSGGGPRGPGNRPTSLPDGLVFPSELSTQPQSVGKCAGCRQQPGL